MHCDRVYIKLYVTCRVENGLVAICRLMEKFPETNRHLPSRAGPKGAEPHGSVCWLGRQCMPWG